MAIHTKQLGTAIKEVILRQKNAPVHKSVVAMTAVLDCGFELVDHLPYAPDLGTIAATDWCTGAFSC